MPRTTKTILLLLLAFLAIAQIAHILTHPADYQWDFRTYYTAARVQATGQSPYDAHIMKAHGEGALVSMYLYPPLTVWLFRPFLAFSYQTAAAIWLLLKVMVAGGLLYLWRRRFVRDWSSVMGIILVMFGFGACVYIDLASGNISILEQFLLWLGLAFLLAKRETLFAVFVTLAACFKLTPALFLIAAFMAQSPKRWRTVGLGAAAMLVWVGANYAIDPTEFARYLDNATTLQETGAQGNPSHFRFWSDLLAVIADQTNGSFPDMVPRILFGLTALAIMWFSYRAWRALSSRRGAKEMESILLLSVTYALLMPRLKSYSFILVLPAAYFVLMSGRHLPATGALLALFVSSAIMPLPNPVPLGPYFVLLWLFYPLLLTALVWGVLLNAAQRRNVQ